MKVRDIYNCSNVWADTEVIIDRNLETVFKGMFGDVPESLKEQEVEFWAIQNMGRKKKDMPKIATEIFVALK